MAFLDNTGLERLWQHIIARFANREDLEIMREGNILDNSNFLTPIRQREDFRRSGSITITMGGTSGGASGGGSATNTT